MVTVRTTKSFKKAIFSHEDEIKVDDPKLSKWVVIIYGIGKVAWGAALIIIAAGITTLIVSGGSSAPASVPVVASSVMVVGSGGTAAMVGLAIAFGGITGLKLLRNKYKITQKGNDFVIL